MRRLPCKRWNKRSTPILEIANRMKTKQLIIFIILMVGCKEKYVVQVNTPSTGFLVVEGFINISGNTDIVLTRSSGLDTPRVILEPGAEVDIQMQGGTSYPLAEASPGHYSNTGLSLDPSQQYRLHIRTANGKEYESDYSVVKITPPIDSVNWTGTTNSVTGDEINIFVTTHDDQSQPGYYQWQFEETWKYNAKYESVLEYQNGPLILRPLSDLIYTCWLSDTSTSINIANTEKLNSNIIYQYPLTQIPYNTSNKLINRYSILVKQYAITSDWYEWNQKIKKNTEQLGSIFDAQPSETGGNIHCVTDPGESVIGFIGCTTETQERIFIDRTEIPRGVVSDGYDYCQPDTVGLSQEDIDLHFKGGYLIPITYVYKNGFLYGIQSSTVDCVDCRAKGGTSVKPPFWQ
jgi:hypothetical protein